MKRFFLNLLRLDRNINADIFNGNRKETMSGRMGRKEVEGKKGWRLWVCRCLSFIDPRPGDHCIESIEKDQ